MHTSHIFTSIDTSINFFSVQSVRNLFDSFSTSEVSLGLMTITDSSRSTSITEDHSEVLPSNATQHIAIMPFDHYSSCLVFVFVSDKRHVLLTC